MMSIWETIFWSFVIIFDGKVPTTIISSNFLRMLMWKRNTTISSSKSYASKIACWNAKVFSLMAKMTSCQPLFICFKRTWWNKNQVNVHSSNQMCLYKCMKKEQILSNKNKKNHCNAEWCHFAISTIAKLSWSFSSNNWSKVVFFCNGPAFICINLKDKCSQPFDIKWIFSWNSCRAVFFGKKLTLPCKRNVWWRDEQTTIQFSAPDFEMVQCLKSMESFL